MGTPSICLCNLYFKHFHLFQGWVNMDLKWRKKKEKCNEVGKKKSKALKEMSEESEALKRKLTGKVNEMSREITLGPTLTSWGS